MNCIVNVKITQDLGFTEESKVFVFEEVSYILKQLNMA